MIVFYDSIWIKANKNITRSLVAQLKAIDEVYQNDKKNLDFFTDSYKNNFNFEIGISKGEFPEISGERKFSPMDRSLRRELKSAFGNNKYWFRIHVGLEDVGDLKKDLEKAMDIYEAQ